MCIYVACDRIHWIITGGLRCKGNNKCVGTFDPSSQRVQSLSNLDSFWLLWWHRSQQHWSWMAGILSKFYSLSLQSFINNVFIKVNCLIIWADKISQNNYNCIFTYLYHIFIKQQAIYIAFFTRWFQKQISSKSK